MDFPKTYFSETGNFNINQFPVVLKIDSPNIVHKSDFGAVFLDISSKSEMNDKVKVAKSMLKKYNIKEYSFIVQEQLEGTELILGMKRDKIFGPVILLGLGGVFVEVLKDVSMRIAPLSKKDCKDMIEDLKGKQIIEGYRNFPKLDKELIVTLLLSLSKMSIQNPEILEIDLNPVIMTQKKAIVADARVIVEKC